MPGPKKQLIRRKTVYYAHPMTLYNTPTEARDLALLTTLGFQIANPNTRHHQDTSDGDMEYFYRLVRACDVFCFRALPSGDIPCGVAGELRVAQAQKLPIFEIPTQIRIRTLDMNETMEYYHNCGNR